MWMNKGERDMEILLSNNEHLNFRLFTTTHWKPEKFSKTTDSLILRSDSPTDIREHYEHLLWAIKSSHTHNADVLPEWDRIKAGVSIKELIQPKIKSYHYSPAMAFITTIDKDIWQFYTKPTDNPPVCEKRTPLAFTGMSTCTTRSGLDLIDSIHKYTVFKCGAIVDPLANLYHFNVRRSDSLMAYLNRANKCEKDIADAGAILAPNQIMDTILRKLKEC